jgi:DNA-directed RNA polymerase specialized sigma24 family protein
LAKDKLTETELIKAIEHRSYAAYLILYDRYAPLLFKIILAKLKDREMAADIMEATFLRICSNIPEYHLQSARFTLWAAGIAKQCALRTAGNLT